MLNPKNINVENDVKRALEEDLGGELNATNDITAQLIPVDRTINAVIIARENGIFCGKAWAEKSFTLVDSATKLDWAVKDGDAIDENQPLVKIEGAARSILTSERTALNFLQMLSGTATTAHVYASKLAGTQTTMLDTRKTIPGFRNAQKYAVTCGGAQNHRFGLYDAYLIKENHIAACGGIENAVTKARKNAPNIPVEVEVENLDELHEAIASGADIVMLDNFDIQQIQSAVSINKGRSKLEVSGNITDEKLLELANIGVDYISSGALTKHISALDLSLLIA
ncbi:MAG: carboxylating nicotinate-nucleotide diphosphorylase [Pseudomonadota bacterium]